MAKDSNHIRILNITIGLVMVSLSVLLFFSIFEIIRVNKIEDNSVVITGNYDVTFNDEVYNDVEITSIIFLLLRREIM